MNFFTTGIKGMHWKDKLKEMKYRYMEAKTPAAFIASGGRTMKIKPYTDKTSNGLTTCINDWINGAGCAANRINTQGQVRKERVEFFQQNAEISNRPRFYSRNYIT